MIWDTQFILYMDVHKYGLYLHKHSPLKTHQMKLVQTTVELYILDTRKKLLLGDVIRQFL